MAVKLKGCAVYFYDESGALLLKTTVSAYDPLKNSIEVDKAPELADKSRYNLLILTEPSPHRYSCIAEIINDRVILKIFNGEKKEMRSNVRHTVNGHVKITAYLFEGKAYRLHTPQDAVLVNISKGGVRLRMKANSLSLEDLVHINIQTGDTQKILSALVVNMFSDDETAEYGCKLVLRKA